MGFEDLFEHNRKHYKDNHDNHYAHDDYYQKSHLYNRHNDIKQLILNRLQNNPKLKVVLIIIIIFLTVIIITAAILLLPFLLKLFNYVSENGIQGFLNNIWSGTKK